MTQSKIGLVGCGTLGGKMAGDFAYHGHEVWVYDQSSAALDDLVERLKYDKEELRKDNLLMQTEFVGNVYYMNRLEKTVRKSGFIFESVSEDLEIKQDLIERISHCANSDAVIATTTMYLNLDEVFARALKPERCIGIRFLFPVYYVPEVEVTLSSKTSNETLTKEYIKNFQNSRGLRGRPRLSIPNLIPQGSSFPLLNDENQNHQVKDCVICMDAVRDSTLLPCFHVCICTKCAKMLMKREGYCPVCRKEITEVGPHYYP
ncbi:5-formyl-3-hydroxy-2-methylpyridine 4-carboxylate 5-dehydrogenase-like isoform X2 [Tachypleus tridentatus]|uniref:5-formyl-3-hydroxy-2-methylpyridine 4-carboxylate 5-dehydrogenase-like isoform X2 n=1 Tax=Tachypleus tridentatus TaxID=6853 RepID=UPI003FD29AE0